MAAKQKIVILAVCLACTAACIAGCAPKVTGETAAPDVEAKEPADGGIASLGIDTDYPSEGRYVDNIAALPDVLKHSDKDKANGENNNPRVYTDRNGFTVQPVPDDPIGWNVSYLDADSRGCTSCHTLEDALMSLPTYHRLIFQGYPTEQTLANCVVCHTWSETPLKDTIHAIHTGSTSFTQTLNGSCDSCHYVDTDGQFKRWDYEKYNLYHGITLLTADEAAAKVSYDQDTITPKENRFYKTLMSEPSEWLTDDANVDASIGENWTIKFSGDIENPCELTLPELVEKLGTTEEVMKADCVVNGVGNATIFQAKVGGVPLKALVDFLKPKAGANVVRSVGDDTYHEAGLGNAIPLELALQNNALLVTQMDGETLPGSQGYPVAFWMGSISSADYVKKVAEIKFETVDAAELADPLKLIGAGQFVDPASGTVASKPNAAVLNYPSGVVLDGQAGKPVSLEGFADAWDEPVTKVEFSFDKGKTWTVMDVKDCDPQKWVYWRLEFTPQEAGPYLLDIRTTSQQPDGADRVSYYNTQFLMNVR